jgi:hypothetical protein
MSRLGQKYIYQESEMEKSQKQQLLAYGRRYRAARAVYAKKEWVRLIRLTGQVFRGDVAKASYKPLKNMSFEDLSEEEIARTPFGPILRGLRDHGYAVWGIIDLREAPFNLTDDNIEFLAKEFEHNTGEVLGWQVKERLEYLARGELPLKDWWEEKIRPISQLWQRLWPADESQQVSRSSR